MSSWRRLTVPAPARLPSNFPSVPARSSTTCRPLTASSAYRTGPRWSPCCATAGQIRVPVTRYAVSGDSHVAYQVLGDGPRDLILIPGFVSNVETAWMWPAHARFLRRLAAGRRLIVFDKRGTGLSDPVADPSCLTIEQRMDDVRAVMDAADAHRAALFGFSEGVALGMLFAASYPSRTNGLILYGGLISPALDTAANAVVNVFADPAAAWEIMRQAWGTGQFMAPFLPSAARTKSEMAHVARFERHGASPAAAYAIIRMAASIEVRGLCPAVHAPSLVMHRRDDVLVPPANSRYLAEHLPDVRYVELDGADHPLWVGENERFFDELNRFLSTDHPALSGPPSLLAVLLATDRALDAVPGWRDRAIPGTACSRPRRCHLYLRRGGPRGGMRARPEGAAADPAADGARGRTPVYSAGASPALPRTSLPRQ